MIEVLDLSKNYRRVAALRDVECRFEPGITGVLGPNGAGKTTLLRCLATTLMPDSGTVLYKGNDIQAPEHRYSLQSELGYVPQEMGTLPNMRAAEFVEYMVVARRPAWSASERETAVQSALSRVGLTDRAASKARTLSGGMKQRLLVAQALATDPKVLILDEPTVGLDPQQRSRFRALLASVGQERTVVLSTHLIEDILALATPTVLVLDRGAAVFAGSITKLAELARDLVSIRTRPSSDAPFWYHDGTYRVVGKEGSGNVEPLPEDGYLWLVGQRAMTDADTADSWESA